MNRLAREWVVAVAHGDRDECVAGCPAARAAWAAASRAPHE